MKVLVDTSVWSLALRRSRGDEGVAVAALRRLVEQGRVAIIGPIRQELLSGLRSADAFVRLRDHLSAFRDEPLESTDFERAAEHYNTCRASGVQGSNTDFLICAVAERRSLAIFTTDHDLGHFAKHLPIALYHPR